MKTINKYIDDALGFLLHCSLMAEEYTTQREQYEEVYGYIEKLEDRYNELKDVLEDVLRMGCCIKHNIEKYEEVGLDHLEYALCKTEELNDFVREVLEEYNDKLDN